MTADEDGTHRLVSMCDGCRQNEGVDDCLDLCSECLADVPAFLTSEGAICAACAAIALRVPTIDRDQLLAVIEERAELEQARTPA